MVGAIPRIGVASLVQETNTFSPKPTEWEDFTVLVGAEAEVALEGTNTEFAGAVSELRQQGADYVPLVAAWALPSGRVTDTTFSQLSELLDASIKQAGELDGLVLSLHGAMVSESHFDADSALIEIARRRMGGAPVGVCLDLHANLTARMVELADVMVGYHTEPHIDMGPTGERIARLLAATVRSEITPTMALAKRSLLIPAEGMRTDLGPMSEVRKMADGLIRDRVLDVSVFPVQPWLDVPELGLGVLVAADDDADGAFLIAEQLAYEVWRRRGRMVTPRILPTSVAFATARLSSTRPFVMAHTADCPTAGASGDDPILVTEAARHGADLRVMHSVLDADAARKCRHAVGTRTSVSVGGAINPDAQPVTVEGLVTNAGAGSYRLTGCSFTGMEVSMGEWAVLTTGRHHLLISSRPAITADPATWRHAGLDPNRADVLVVRSCSDYRANFPSAAPEAITLDLPGASPPRLEYLRFQNAPRPLYPLDPTLL
ncbi:MAG: M81 family metallopeptidase [Actinomycetia bacterium]|nr:M81 family metallopeptidase [Actinomycetes bacterium]